MSDDFVEDPLVDAELRDFIQKSVVQPTHNERQSFWKDLEQKLDDSAETPPQKPGWLSRLPLKTYLPLAAACAAVALFMALPTSQQGEQAFTTMDNTQEAPMVLGAAPEKKEKPQHRFRSKAIVILPFLSASQQQTLKEMGVQWEKQGEIYELHVPLSRQADFLKQLQQWPHPWKITPQSVQQKIGYKSYRVDFSASSKATITPADSEHE